MSFKHVKSRYLVPYDGSFRVAKARTTPPKGAPSRKACRERLARAVEALSDLQDKL